jgi:signal recognition particle receptor subunit beta
LWWHYFEGAEGLIFVIDSTDAQRLDDVLTELQYLLTHEELRGTPLLVLVNKSDLPQSLPLADIMSRLRIEELGRGRKWFVQRTCGITGEGLEESMEWLSKIIAKR